MLVTIQLVAFTTLIKFRNDILIVNNYYKSGLRLEHWAFNP